MEKTPNDTRRLRIHTSSLGAIAIALYSASVDDRDTMACFLVFHEIGDPPRVINYSVNDLRDSGHAPQLESQNP